jgi:hypothetical protein
LEVTCLDLKQALGPATGLCIETAAIVLVIWIEMENYSHLFAALHKQAPTLPLPTFGSTTDTPEPCCAMGLSFKIDKYDGAFFVSITYQTSNNVL